MIHAVHIDPQEFAELNHHDTRSKERIVLRKHDKMQECGEASWLHQTEVLDGEKVVGFLYARTDTENDRLEDQRMFWYPSFDLLDFMGLGSRIPHPPIWHKLEEAKKSINKTLETR